MSAVTLKVEFSVEGGSTAVLYDNAQTPMQQLPYGAQEQLRVQTDIKEQGLITIVASAVFTGGPAWHCPTSRRAPGEAAWAQAACKPRDCWQCLTPVTHTAGSSTGSPLCSAVVVLPSHAPTQQQPTCVLRAPPLLPLLLLPLLLQTSLGSASTTCSFSSLAQPVRCLSAHVSGTCPMPSLPAAALQATGVAWAGPAASWRSTCRTAHSW